jgi:hypothetical protein
MSKNKRARTVARTKMISDLYHKSPGSLFQCLRSHSRIPGACLRCAIVTDDANVEKGARAHLRAPIITSGHAVHTGKNSAKDLTDGNMAKIYVDWWLLALSHTMLRATGDKVSSTFSATAGAFRDGTDEQGRTINLVRECKW